MKCADTLIFPAAKSDSSARQAIFSVRISWHGHSSCEVSLGMYLSAVVFVSYNTC